MFKREEKKYENGLVHVHYYVPFLRSLSMNYAVKTGKANEYTPEAFGISHFLEHMLFNGSEKYPRFEETSKIASELGFQENAWTWLSITNYHMTSPVKSYSKAFDILSQRTFKPLLLEETVEKEKGIIQEERKMRDNQPPSIVEKIISADLFKDSSYADGILGTEESIDNFTREALKEHHARYYSSNNTWFVTYGGMKFSDVLDFSEEFNKSLEKQDIPEHNSKIKMENPFKQEVILEERMDVPGAFYSRQIAFDIVTNIDDYISLLLFEALLFKGEGAYLPIKLQKESSDVSSIRGGLFPFRDMIAIEVTFSLAEEKVKTVTDKYSDVLEYAVNSVTELYFARARGYLEGDLVRNLESLDYVSQPSSLSVERINQFYDLQLTPDLLLKKIRNYTLEDYKTTMARLWKGNISQHAVIRPKK
jgi:zinc protease